MDVKKIILSLCVMLTAVLLLTNASVTAFANSGGARRPDRALTAEEKKIVGTWTEPPLTYVTNKWGYKMMSPEIEFYDNGRGRFSITVDISGHIDLFRFDPETSEYVLITEENSEYVEMGRARLVSGQPRKLNISGTFIDRETHKRVRYQYELARESDAKSMRAPPSPGWFTVEDSEWAWLAGKWKTLSGDQAVLSFRDSNYVIIRLSDSDDERFFDDDGNEIYNNTATAVWDDKEKAFRLLSIAMFGDMETAINHDFGYLRPSSGKFAPSETLELEYYESSLALRAVLSKDGAVSRPSAPSPASEPSDEHDDSDTDTDPDEPAGSYVLSATDADLSKAPDVIVENSPYNLGGWRVGNRVAFHVDVEEEGDYLVTLLYSKQESDGDRADLKISIDGGISAAANLPFTGKDWSNYVEHEFCILPLPAGKTTLTIESANPRGGGYVMNLRSVTIR
jgi:hypothetical protein